MPGADRAACEPAAAQGEVGSVCGFQNPEDLEYARGAGVIVVSNMNHDRAGDAPGYLAALDPQSLEVRRLWPQQPPLPSRPEPELGDAECEAPPDPAAFYPHGLASRSDGDRTILYVTAHAGDLGGREAVEIFGLTGRRESARLSWLACIPTKRAIQANDVAVSPTGEVVVSNYQPNKALSHTVRAFLFGSSTGDVMAWRRADGWRHVPETEAALANGVAIMRGGDRILFAESITGEVHRVPLAGGGGGYSIEVGGNPDNFTWTPRETLLLPTHTAGVELFVCGLGKSPCTSSWEIYEVDPSTMASTRIFSHDGARIGAVSTALELGKRLYLGAVYDDRVGIISLR